MTTLERQQRRYNEEDIERALIVLATNSGNSRRASQELADQGIDIPHRTLHGWKRIHAERYDRIYAEHLPKLREKAAQAIEERISMQDELARKTMERMRGELDELDAKDLPKTLKDLEVAMAVGTDKTLALRGMPTSIVEHRTADHTWAKLKEMGLVVEGTATELPPSELPASSTETHDKPARASDQDQLEH